MTSVEKYLKPEVIRQISRLDLRAQFVVKGFLQGLHASPFHGFSVEFSEHRKYTAGDDPKDIDWLVYAKTDKYYVKKFEAETELQLEERQEFFFSRRASRNCFLERARWSEMRPSWAAAASGADTHTSVSERASAVA